MDGPAASYFVNRQPANWNNSSLGSGAAFSREQALWSTVGEAMERYSASIYDNGDFLIAREAELPGPAINLADCILFTPGQQADEVFPFRPYDPEKPRAWVEGRDCLTASPIWAPAQMVYLSQGWPPEDVLGQTVSTGNACHISVERAMLAGMLEQIERDGFTSAWLLKYAPPKLNLDDTTKSKLSAPCLKAIASSDLPITLCAAPNEFGVFNIFAFAEHRELGVGVVGACARLDLAAAVEKAVVEALHGWSACHRARNGAEAFPEKHEIKNPHDHSLFYHQPGPWADMSWFRSSPETVDSTDLQRGPPIAGPRELAARLAAGGIASSWYELTSEDVGLLGFRVVRVLAPGLQPLTFGAGLISGDRRRLEANARFWRLDPDTVLNSEPHPFP
ncbi:MAG TPA: YcaO-like family protein [Allosphingosinicella sp.]|nr:YcaO-like family protein [Allosphingosinicella sp.]